MKKKLKMVYWKGNKFWVGKLLDYPEITRQNEIDENLARHIIKELS